MTWPWLSSKAADATSIPFVFARRMRSGRERIGREALKAAETSSQKLLVSMRSLTSLFLSLDDINASASFTFDSLKAVEPAEPKAYCGPRTAEAT